MSTGRDDRERGGENFLGRWSSRKRGTAAARPPPGTGETDGTEPGAGSEARVGDPAPDIAVVPGTGPVSGWSEASASSGAGASLDDSRPAGAASVDAGAVSGAERGNATDLVIEGDATVEADVSSGGDDAPLLTDADMPPIESLDTSSDLSVFFGRDISAALRRAALRHVFSQPAYNVRDGLNDYDGDFTVFEPLGDTVTSDMKFHAARRERDRRERDRLERERLERERLETERLAERESVRETGETGDAAAGAGESETSLASDDGEGGVEHSVPTDDGSASGGADGSDATTPGEGADSTADATSVDADHDDGERHV